MTDPESRLDRIERVLDTLASNQLAERDARLAIREDLEILYQTIRAVADNSEADRQQSNRGVANLAGHLDRLAVGVTQLVAQTEQLAQGQQTLQAGLDNLAGLVVRLAQDAATDRAEIRRIWEYLEGQQRSQGNGHS